MSTTNKKLVCSLDTFPVPNPGTSLIGSMQDSPSPDHKQLFQSVHDKDGFFYLQVGINVTKKHRGRKKC